MASGRLSMTDKYIVQGMSKDNKTLEEMAKTIGKNPKAIENYLQSVEEIQNTVATIKTNEVMQNEVPEAPNSPTSPEVVNKAVYLIKACGYTELDAQKLVNQALRTYFSNTGTDNPEKLKSFALQFVKAGELMNKTSAGGSEGVSIMTEAASQRGDKRATKPSSKVKNSVHKLKG
jgi:hypothetical protein